MGIASTWARALVVAAISWAASVTLGLLFAAYASGSFSLSTLRLPGVVPVALLVSTVIAAAIFPLALWSARTGARNLRVYGPVLWMALAAYVVLVIPRTGADGPYGLLLLGVIGLVALGFVPAAKAQSRGHGAPAVSRKTRITVGLLGLLALVILGVAGIRFGLYLQTAGQEMSRGKEIELPTGKRIVLISREVDVSQRTLRIEYRTAYDLGRSRTQFMAEVLAVWEGFRSEADRNDLTKVILTPGRLNVGAFSMRTTTTFFEFNRGTQGEWVCPLCDAFFSLPDVRDTLR